MPLESVTYVSDLVPTNPAATDLKAEGDDHLRNIKTALKNTFPNVANAVTVTHTQLNTIPNLAPLASPALTGVPTAPTASTGTNTTQLSTTAFVQNALATMPSGTLPSITGKSLQGLRVNAGETGVEWGSSGLLTIDNKTGAYTVVASDLGKVINCTSGTFTVALTAAATLGAGFNFEVWNTGTGSITVDPNASETIDGTNVGANFVLRPQSAYKFVCNGTGWKTTALSISNTGGYGVQLCADAFANGIFCIAIGRSALAAGGGAGIAIGQSANATGTAAGGVAIGSSANVTASYGTAIGQNSAGTSSQAVTGSGAMALGGSYASGTDSFAAAIGNNTSTYGAKGANSIAIGLQANAGANGAVAIGSNTNGNGSGAVAIGDGNSALGNRSLALGYQSFVGVDGKLAYSAGQISAQGDAQYGLIVLRRSVAAAASGTSLVLTSNTAGPTTSNQLVLPTSGQAVTATVLMIGKQTVATKTAAYTSTFTVVNTAGTLTLQGGTWTAVGTASIDATFTAPPTISVSGTEVRISSGVSSAAATNWVAVVQSAEILF